MSSPDWNLCKFGLCSQISVALVVAALTLAPRWIGRPRFDQNGIHSSAHSHFAKVTKFNLTEKSRKFIDSDCNREFFPDVALGVDLTLGVDVTLDVAVSLLKTAFLTRARLFMAFCLSFVVDLRTLSGVFNISVIDLFRSSFKGISSSESKVARNAGVFCSSALSSLEELLGVLGLFWILDVPAFGDADLLQNVVMFMLPLGVIRTSDPGGNVSFHSGFSLFPLNKIAGGIELPEALPQDTTFPSTKQDWFEVAAGFKNKWQFINCGGALDGKHMRIVPPPGSGAQYFNYKNFYSIVLMALVNSDYEFISMASLHLPNNTETEDNLNFVFLGDEAFSLHENF
nr:unnamed protein product [Callosobruchus chinensis]